MSSSGGGAAANPSRASSVARGASVAGTAGGRRAPVTRSALRAMTPQERADYEASLVASSSIAAATAASKSTSRSRPAAASAVVSATARTTPSLPSAPTVKATSGLPLAPVRSKPPAPQRRQRSSPPPKRDEDETQSAAATDAADVVAVKQEFTAENDHETDSFGPDLGLAFCVKLHSGGNNASAAGSRKNKQQKPQANQPAAAAVDALAPQFQQQFQLNTVGAVARAMKAVAQAQIDAAERAGLGGAARQEYCKQSAERLREWCQVVVARGEQPEAATSARGGEKEEEDLAKSIHLAAQQTDRSEGTFEFEMDGFDIDSLPVVSLSSLMSSGNGMPHGAHMLRNFGEITDGLFLGAQPGVDELTTHVNVRLLIRMNASHREPPFRVFKRPFFNDALVVGTTSSPGDGVAGRGSRTHTDRPHKSAAAAAAAASQETGPKSPEAGQSPVLGAVSEAEFHDMLAAVLSGDCSPHPHESPIRWAGKQSWMTTPLFVRSICADDEPGFDISVHFEETVDLISRVLYARQQAIAHGVPSEVSPSETPATATTNVDGNGNDDAQPRLSATPAVEQPLRILLDKLPAAASPALSSGAVATKRFPAGNAMLGAAHDGKASATLAHNKFRTNYGPPLGEHLWAPCVAINCAAGMSRSASIVAAYILRRTRAADARDVLSFMRKKRAVVDPNSGFQQQLQRYRDTEFLPLHDPAAFARLAVAKHGPQGAAEIMSRAAYWFVTARRPDEFDFFALHRAVRREVSAVSKQEQQEDQLDRQSALALCVGALRRALDEDLDQENGHVFSAFLMATDRGIRADPLELVTHFPAANTSATASLPPYAFSDSLAHHVIWHVVFDPEECSNGGGGLIELEASPAQEAAPAAICSAVLNDDEPMSPTDPGQRSRYSDGARRPTEQLGLLGRVEDARKRCARALRLCNLHGSSGTRLTAVMALPRQYDNSAAAEVSSQLAADFLEPVCTLLRRSYAFMPFLVFFNSSFWSDVAAFIPSRALADAAEKDPRFAVGDDGAKSTAVVVVSRAALHILEGLLRAPIAGGSSTMEHATSPLLLGVLAQQLPPEPPRKRCSHAATTPTQATNDASVFVPVVVKVRESSSSSSNSGQAGSDPEVELFVTLALRSAMQHETAAEGAAAAIGDSSDVDAETSHLLQRVTACIAEWVGSVCSRAAATSDVDAGASRNSASPARLAFLCVLVEKAVGAVVATAMTLSPQLRTSTHQVRARGKDDPSRLLPLPKIASRAQQGALLALLGPEPRRHHIATAIASGCGLALDERDTAVLAEAEARTTSRLLQFLALTVDSEHGLMHQ